MIYGVVYVGQRRKSLIMSSSNPHRHYKLGLYLRFFFHPRIFMSSSVFTSLDYLFWRLQKGDDFTHFPWIMWYIWKNTNDKIYKNKNQNPHEILRIAKVERTILAEAQLSVKKNHGDIQPDFVIHRAYHSVMLMELGGSKMFLPAKDGIVEQPIQMM